MKKKNSLLMVMGTLAVMSFCTISLVLFPNVIPFFDLSTDQASNIGSTIGGITSPIVGMFSAYLIYEALTAQLKGNKDQQIKADSDIIFLLLNQLDKEYDSFDLKQTKGAKDIYLFGYNALAEICHLYKVNSVSEVIYTAFESGMTTNRILYMIRSFMMIRERVLLSDFSSDIESMFMKKLSIYYESKFKYPIKHLVEAFDDVDSNLMSEIKDFQKINLNNAYRSNLL